MSSSCRAARIVIFTDEPGWHGVQLKAWFAAHGAQAEYVSLMDCHVDLQANAAGLVIGPGGTELPDGVAIAQYGQYYQTLDRDSQTFASPANSPSFAVVAKGHVSGDGATIATDPGESIPELTWLGVRLK